MKRPNVTSSPNGSGLQWKYVLGGLAFAGAILLLTITATQATAQYYLTVDELLENPELSSKRAVRISGVVDGETIEYDAQSLSLRFTIAHVPADLEEIKQQGGFEQVLHRAVQDPATNRLRIIYRGPKPDHIQHESQAILVGKLGEDGVFYADELLLKCPTRYVDEFPLQSSDD